MYLRFENMHNLTNGQDYHFKKAQEINLTFYNDTQIDDIVRDLNIPRNVVGDIYHPTIADWGRIALIMACYGYPEHEAIRRFYKIYILETLDGKIENECKIDGPVHIGLKINDTFFYRIIKIVNNDLLNDFFKKTDMNFLHDEYMKNNKICLSFDDFVKFLAIQIIENIYEYEALKSLNACADVYSDEHANRCFSEHEKFYKIDNNFKMRVNRYDR